MDNINDIYLVGQTVIFNDREAFGRLVAKYQSPIRRFFLSQTLGDSQLSDDLAQDTFVKAYTSLSTFKGLSGFSTWLYRIAYNVYYDHLRRCRPTAATDTAAVALAAAGAPDPMLRSDIYRAMACLSDAERTCVTLQLIDGYRIAKIASITGMAQGTVKSHLSRGKTKLANFLKQNGYDR